MFPFKRYKNHAEWKTPGNNNMVNNKNDQKLTEGTFFAWLNSNTRTNKLM